MFDKPLGDSLTFRKSDKLSERTIKLKKIDLRIRLQNFRFLTNPFKGSDLNPAIDNKH